MPDKNCSIQDCGRSASRRNHGKRGMCSMHYQRYKKHGDPSRVDRTPSPAKDWINEHAAHNGSECLIWPFHIGVDGYGRVHRENDGPLTTASRMMCETVHGKAPSRKHEAAHSCGKGNRGCVNPRHLYWATPSENQMDRVWHGTSNRGERQHGSKLTENEVLEIRSLKGVMPRLEVAGRYGIDPTTVSHVWNVTRWVWLR